MSPPELSSPDWAPSKRYPSPSATAATANPATATAATASPDTPATASSATPRDVDELREVYWDCLYQAQRHIDECVAAAVAFHDALAAAAMPRPEPHVELAFYFDDCFVRHSRPPRAPEPGSIEAARAAFVSAAMAYLLPERAGRPGELTRVAGEIWSHVVAALPAPPPPPVPSWPPPDRTGCGVAYLDHLDLCLREVVTTARDLKEVRLRPRVAMEKTVVDLAKHCRSLAAAAGKVGDDDLNGPDRTNFIDPHRSRGQRIFEALRDAHDEMGASLDHIKEQRRLGLGG